MCRFIGFLGHPLILDDVLFKTHDSLIQQSIHAKEMAEPLNGDGFGISWYLPQIDPHPAVFRSIQPAWNDVNLSSLAQKIKSPCFLAHVRAASIGGVNILNTHPFVYKDYVFMHNGDIGGFEKIRRSLTHDLSDEMFQWVKGQTDSEHFFAAFLDRFHRKEKEFNPANVVESLRETIHYIDELRTKHQAPDSNSINAVVTDGKSMVGVRYISDPKEKASSLHYSVGNSFEFRDGACHMSPTIDKKNKAVLIASEKLTSHKADWKDVPTNHFILVSHDLDVDCQPV